ncbi:hypothetical protein TNCV_3028481 [Trichonephila clavipes]|nr:hypothetical protein TNCV_3028481 [Trichonephila clavipes]
MPLGKCEVFIVAIATVYCVCLHGKGSHALKELKELDLAILEHELLQKYAPESGTDEEDGTVNVNSNEWNVLQQAGASRKMATSKQKEFCVLQFAKTESAINLQRAFRIKFGCQPPNDNNILR